MASEKAEVWAAGDAYEPYVGRWSRAVARQFIDWLAVAPGATWLDIGCGTGALTSTILAHAAPARVLAMDSSDGYLAHARARIDDPRVEIEPGDAQQIPLQDSLADAVVSGLLLNFVPDKTAALRAMTRVVRPDGTVALYVWDYAGEMQLMRRFWDAAVELDPAARSLDEGVRFPICAPDPLRALFAETGLRDIDVRTIDVPTVFRDFDDYWSPFLGGQGPAPGYCMSLGEEKRIALRERLRASLPAAPDGTIALIARAYAVRAVR